MRSAVLLLAAVALAAPPAARALLVLEDGRSQLYVEAGTELSIDSNVFANSDQLDDTYLFSHLGLEYERRSGLFGINAVAEWTNARFNHFRDQNFTAPAVRLSVNRERGRLTGRFEFGRRETSEADTAANVRTRFQDTTSQLVLRYPLNHRFSIGSTTEYLDRAYARTVFFDRTEFSEALDLFRAHTSKLDLLAGYRVRRTDLRREADRTDHAFTVGAMGKLLPRLDGTLRLGYQLRSVGGGGRIGAYTAAIATIWTPRDWANITLHASRDFSTTSTALTTDATTIGFDTRFKAVKGLAFTAGAGWGRYNFYAATRRTRDDDNLYLRAALEYPVTRQLKAVASVTLTRNDSSFAFADFDRRLFNLGISGRF